MTITLPYPPSANRYWRVFQGIARKSKEASAYQFTAAAMARSQGMLPIVDGEVRVTIDVYRPAKRGDVDNSVKILVDALKGIAFTDDKQVKRIEIERHDTDRHHPRAVVTVEAIESQTAATAAKG